ncbi:MAG: hypothetical protein M3P49_11460, partial [Actinomycetota bacterium]|nr:hypothetical protein [Actinomycetota bacterium]
IGVLTLDADNTLALDNAAANINKTGRSSLRSHVSGGQPTGKNVVAFSAFDDTTAGRGDPRLLVDYVEGVSLTHVATDSVAGADAATPARNVVRVFADVEGPADAAQTARAIRTSATDAAGAADAYASLRARTQADPIGETDPVTSLVYATITRTASDPLGGSDAATFARARALVEALGGLDSHARVQAFSRQASDHLGGTDPHSTQLVILISRIATDLLGLADPYARRYGLGRQDVVALSAPYASAQRYERTVLDAAGLLDAVQRRRARSATDASSGTDAYAASFVLLRALADGFSGADSARRGYGRSLAEPLAALDPYAKVQGIRLSPADPLGAADFYVSPKGLLVSAADAFGLGDERLSRQGRNVADPLGFVEAVPPAIVKANLLVTDALAGTDNPVLQRAVYLALTDLLSARETPNVVLLRGLIQILKGTLNVDTPLACALLLGALLEAGVGIEQALHADLRIE